MFRKAVKHEAKLRLAIAGTSGSGKTYTALAVAKYLAQGQPVAMVDTEHGSGSKYADLFEFDVMELKAPFHPDRFSKAIAEAGKAGYKVLILDSLSHAWNGTGGLLEIVDEAAKRMRSKNSFAAWKDATPIQNRLIESILAADLHIIATMRSKQEYVIEQIQRDGRTTNVPRKVGMAPIQRDGFEYEFDVFLDMDTDNNAIVSKTRCPALTGKVFKKPGEDVAEILITWLQGEIRPEQKSDKGTDPGPSPDPAEESKAAKLAKWIREQASLNPNAKLSTGQAGALVGILEGYFEGDADTKRAKRLRLMSTIFDREIASSNDLTEPEKWTIWDKWLLIAPDPYVNEQGKEVQNYQATFTQAGASVFALMETVND